MATDKTPAHKRIARAEKSAIEWKMKSIERREEIESLNLKIKDLANKIEKIDEIGKKISEQDKQIKSLKHDLQKAHLIIEKQHNEIEEFKKKLILKRSKAI